VESGPRSEQLGGRKLGDSIRRTADYLNHFHERVLTDALAEMTADYWLRRAEQFQAAMHKPGDFVGLCSTEQIEANNQLLAAKAEACRNRAVLCEASDDDLDTIRAALDGREVA